MIVIADDFGLSEEVNAAIVEAFDRGLLTGASIIANMPAFEEACELAAEHGFQDRVGTHLNLTEGTPLTERGFDAPLHPDRIWIFQEPIEDECDTDEEIREEIKTTIVHEVAHFFGLDDEYLEDLGY